MLPKGDYTLVELDEMKVKLEEEIDEKRVLVREIEVERQKLLLRKRIDQAVENMTEEEQNIMSQAIVTRSSIGQGSRIGGSK